MSIRLLITLIILLNAFCSCKGQKLIESNLNAGLIRTHFKLSNYNPGENVGDYTSRTWYLDSALILETVVIDFDWNIPLNKRPAARLKIQKYVYMDVKTGLCQDYLKLDPKESYITNYKVTPTDYFNWNLYRTDSVSPLYDKPAYDLSDTIIDGLKFKRIALENVDGPYIMKKIFYQTTNYSTKFLKLSPFIDNKYPGYKVLRTDLLVNNKLHSSLYIVQLRDSLSDDEIKIFKKWGENAKNCKLPILTLKEATLESMNHSYSDE